MVHVGHHMIQTLAEGRVPRERLNQAYTQTSWVQVLCTAVRFCWQCFLQHGYSGSIHSPGYERLGSNLPSRQSQLTATKPWHTTCPLHQAIFWLLHVLPEYPWTLVPLTVPFLVTAPLFHPESSTHRPCQRHTQFLLCNVFSLTYIASYVWCFSRACWIGSGSCNSSVKYIVHGSSQPLAKSNVIISLQSWCPFPNPKRFPNKTR